MAYADYSYYTTTFLGSAIASSDFPRLALRASAVIDQITFDRAAPIVTSATDTTTIDKIKMAMCAVAEELQTQDANNGADVITSESIGGYSVSYGAGSVKQLTTGERLTNSARLWLANTDLLYKGFASGEYSASNVD